MLPKAYRLPKHCVRVVFSKGKRVSLSGITYIYIEGTSPVSRFATVISKKAAKKSVRRNRVKRVVREVIKLTASNMSKPLDGVILVSQAPEKISTKTLLPIVTSLFQKAGVYIAT